MAAPVWREGALGVCSRVMQQRPKQAQNLSLEALHTAGACSRVGLQQLVKLLYRAQSAHRVHTTGSGGAGSRRCQEAAGATGPWTAWLGVPMRSVEPEPDSSTAWAAGAFDPDEPNGTSAN